MHFEILVEDQSGKVALDVLVSKIIGNNHTFKITPFKGVGHIPKNMTSAINANNCLLLNNLRSLLAAYGKWPPGYAAVIVVCDLDDKCLKSFRSELIKLLDTCNPRPETRFCIAIEESEAWFLGDIPAIKQAYPKAKDAVLNTYVSDSICGAWKKLADAVYKGGSLRLSNQGRHVVGAEKSAWAECITPYMDLDNNTSPSFNYFLRKLRELATHV
jgi:hypothetical protein